MNPDEIKFQQYKLYTEQKECFVNRSFYTNKFYLALILVLIVLMFFTKDYSFCCGLTSTLVFSLAGMAICVLWWINMDSYNFLIKIKFSKVIEEIEKSLPVQPFGSEYAAIQDFRKNKKIFMFSDMQKILATLSLLLFFVLFINESTPLLFELVSGK